MVFNVLYYIVSLHQTTTSLWILFSFLLLYYIVSLHQTTTRQVQTLTATWLYYIVSLHQTTTFYELFNFLVGCIISFLYIKPQLPMMLAMVTKCCIISFLYIKPQQPLSVQWSSICCIISFLYIKPQPFASIFCKLLVVLYRFSTSNHNLMCIYSLVPALYYIVSLHQTTTEHSSSRCGT